MKKFSNMCLLLWLGAMFLSCNQLGARRFKQVTSAADKFEQYARADFTVKLTAHWADPFVSSDVALDMVLTSPSGREIVLPAFYYSGNSGEESVWKARFMAQETGRYKYLFRLYENGALVSTSRKGSFVSIESDKRGILRLNDKWTLKFDNGELFRGVGENISWESRENDDNPYLSELHENPRFNYEYLLTSLAANGGNFFRTWMIYWNLPVDWKIVRNTNRYENSSNRFNESGIRRMDELVELSDSLGIHFMLALQAHGAFLGEGWDINSYNVKQGGPAETPYEFFTLKEAREMYKDKLRFLVARWGYSPAIGAWEFFNEVDNAMYNVPEYMQLPHDIVTNWHYEMSKYLKSIDPFGHIVTTSISHRNIEGLNEISYIDINQKHIYRNTRIIPATINEYIERYQKPYVIGEFGYEWDWHVDFFDIKEGKISDYKRGLWYGLFSPTPILPMSWWWEFFDEVGVRGYLVNVQTINQMMLDAGQGEFEQIKAEVSESKLINYAVRCGGVYFVYLFNPSDLIVTTQVKLPSGIRAGAQVDIFNCETGDLLKSANFERQGDMLIINELYLEPVTDVVLIIRD